MPGFDLLLLSYGFLLLLLYSFIGWGGEMVYCSLCQRRLCEKRGFLNGPLCPIYGHGALLVLWALHGGCRSPALTFLFGLLLTSWKSCSTCAGGTTPSTASTSTAGSAC